MIHSICRPAVVLLLCSFVLPGQNPINTADFLKHPFDLQQFKQKKGASNSGSAVQKSYYLKPDTSGTYYRFFMFRPMRGTIGKREVHMEDGLQIITYKPKGKYYQDYLDPTETLIEVIAKFNDPDLPELAFVGMDSHSVQCRLGPPQFRKLDCLIYSHERNLLVLHLESEKVNWLKYTRLNFIPDFETLSEELLKIE